MFYELGNNYKFVQSWANLPSIVLEKIFLFTVGQNKENGGPCCPRFRCTDARLQQLKSLGKVCVYWRDTIMSSRLVNGPEYCLESYAEVGRDLIKSGFLSRVKAIVQDRPCQILTSKISST